MSTSNNDIRVCEARDGIRFRPAMYVGDCDASGMHLLAEAIVDDAVGEIASGFARRLVVTMHVDGSIEIEDDGRPIPDSPIAELNDRPVLELVLTEIFAGCGSSPRGQRPWKVGCAGLHGNEFVVANALSEWFSIHVGNRHVTSSMRFERGRVVEPLQQVAGDWFGCRVRFKPDPEIFLASEFSRQKWVNRLRELAALNPTARMEFTDLRVGAREEFTFRDGTAGFVQFLNRDFSPIDAAPITVNFETDIFRLDIAFQHTIEGGSRVAAFVNAIETVEGGTHWIGFKRGLTRAVNQCLRDLGREPLGDGEWLLDGLTACVAIWVDDPTFEGPTRTRFAYSAIQGAVESTVYHRIKAVLVDDPARLDVIEQRARK